MTTPTAPPRVSVVLPACNAEPFIATAVDSILRQTLHDFELIAIDDGSTDRTSVILAERATRDPRVRLVSRPNRGLTRTLNEGVGMARAEYVAIMNADDIALPGRLEKQAAFLDAHPRVAAVGSATRTFTDAGTKTVVAVLPADPAALRVLVAKASPFAHPTVMFRRRSVVDVGLYRPQLEPAEDYDLWLRLAERHDLANLAEPLLEYRLHAGQATSRAFERVALATLVARAAARARREGQRDPAADLNAIDRQAATMLGITDAEVARAAIDAALGRAEMLLATGEPANACRDTLAVLAKDGRIARDAPRLFDAATNWLEARILFSQGRYVAAAVGFIRAAVADPSFRLRLAGALGRRGELQD